MLTSRLLRCALFVSVVGLTLAGGSRTRALAAVRPGPEYLGTCDASAAVALSADRFVMASDQDNVLRVYDATLGGPPKATVDLTAFLRIEAAHPEADIEGATRVRDVIYWITSHGRSKSGQERPNRKRFFATEVGSGPAGPEVKPFGQPSEALLAVMLKEAGIKAHLGGADELAPEAPGGLNIEGLTRRPDGSLLVGFRNPLPGGKALVVSLQNPANVVQGKAPRLGRAISLDLSRADGGARAPAGIRSIEFVDAKNAYVIVAGPPGDGGPFQVFEWSGRESGPAPVATIESGALNPEALVVYPPASAGGAARLQLLSDDGDRTIAGKACKDLRDPKKMRFRSAFLE